MSDKQKADEDIRKLGRMLKGMMSVADDLEMLSSLEQAMVEAKQRLEHHRSVEKDAHVQMEQALKALEESKAQAAHTIDHSKSEAALILEKAKAEALEKVTAADEHARQIAAKADDCKKEAVKDLDAKKAALALIEKQSECRQTELEKVKKEVESIKAKFI